MSDSTGMPPEASPEGLHEEFLEPLPTPYASPSTEVFLQPLPSPDAFSEEALEPAVTPYASPWPESIEVEHLESSLPLLLMSPLQLPEPAYEEVLESSSATPYVTSSPEASEVEITGSPMPFSPMEEDEPATPYATSSPEASEVDIPGSPMPFSPMEEDEPATPNATSSPEASRVEITGSPTPCSPMEEDEPATPYATSSPEASEVDIPELPMPFSPMSPEAVHEEVAETSLQKLPHTRLGLLPMELLDKILSFAYPDLDVKEDREAVELLADDDATEPKLRDAARVYRDESILLNGEAGYLRFALTDRPPAFTMLKKVHLTSGGCFKYEDLVRLNLSDPAISSLKFDTSLLNKRPFADMDFALIPDHAMLKRLHHLEIYTDYCCTQVWGHIQSEPAAHSRTRCIIDHMGGLFRMAPYLRSLTLRNLHLFNSRKAGLKLRATTGKMHGLLPRLTSLRIESCTFLHLPMDFLFVAIGPDLTSVSITSDTKFFSCIFEGGPFKPFKHDKSMSDIILVKWLQKYQRTLRELELDLELFGRVRSLTSLKMLTAADFECLEHITLKWNRGVTPETAAAVCERLPKSVCVLTFVTDWFVDTAALDVVVDAAKLGKLPLLGCIRINSTRPGETEKSTVTIPIYDSDNAIIRTLKVETNAWFDAQLSRS